MNIPSQNMEIERIYTQLLGHGKHSISISSANSGEGVSSIAQALAQRNLLAGNSTLLVDLNMYNPSLNSILELDISPTNPTLFSAPQLVTSKTTSIALAGITPPSRRELIIKLRRPGVIEQCIVEWQKTFDTIIFDTSPINRINANNIPAERVAAACDGAVLVVLAGSTTEDMVTAAINKLNAAGANILGSIYNDRDNPSLKNELLRELRRLKPHFPRITAFVVEWFENNKLLSTED